MFRDEVNNETALRFFNGDAKLWQGCAAQAVKDGRIIGVLADQRKTNCNCSIPNGKQVDCVQKHGAKMQFTLRSQIGITTALIAILCFSQQLVRVIVFDPAGYLLIVPIAILFAGLDCHVRKSTGQGGIESTQTAVPHSVRFTLSGLANRHGRLRRMDAALLL